MTDCPDGAVRDLLPELVHGRLAPDDRRRVDAHVLACADCQQEIALLRALRASLRRSPVVDVHAIASAIPAYRAPQRVWGGWRAAAAIVLLAVGGTSVVVLQRESTGVRDAGVTPVASAAPGAARDVRPALVATSPAVGEASGERALGNPAIDELDDRELSTLLAGLETLEALPSPDEDRPGDLAERATEGTD